MDTPLKDAIQKHVNHVSFHTPAHSGGLLDFGEALARADVTELSYTDNLLNAEGAIAASEREVAKVYGSQNVIYSTSGSTTLIHTAIYALRGRGAFLVWGNAHKSVYDALRHVGAVSYVYFGEDLENAIKNTNAKILVVTTPDYFGKCQNIKIAIALAKKFGVELLVDNAHGAHFGFSTKLPKRIPEECEMVIQSQHKCVSTMTGGATFHISTRLINEMKIAFAEHHSTSPSYPIMLSIESGVKVLAERGEELYKMVFDELEKFYDSVKDLPLKTVQNDDRTRLVLDFGGYSGAEVAAALETDGIFPEMVFGNLVVFIVTPYNCSSLTTLAKALNSYQYLGFRAASKNSIERTNGTVVTSVAENKSEAESAGETLGTFCNPCERKTIACVEPLVLPEVAPLRRLEFGAEYEVVPLAEAVGRHSYREVGFYPPGTPILVSGEQISASSLQILINNRKSLFGLVKEGILVIK